jgi:hypothetical protein
MGPPLERERSADLEQYRNDANLTARLSAAIHAASGRGLF